MLYWALMFLVIALVAAYSASAASPRRRPAWRRKFFVIALVLFVVSLFAGFLRRNSAGPAGRIEVGAQQLARCIAGRAIPAMTMARRKLPGGMACRPGGRFS